MTLTYGTTLLIDGTTLLPGSGWQLPMQQLVGVGQAVHRAGGKPSARGNRTYAYGGSVTRTWSTEAEAVADFLFHALSLPDSADLIVEVGGVEIGRFVAAVLASCIPDPVRGVSVTFHYQFSVGAPVAPTP